MLEQRTLLAAPKIFVDEAALLDPMPIPSGELSNAESLGEVSFGQDVSQTFQGYQVVNTGDAPLQLSDIVQKPNWVTVVDGIAASERSVAPYQPGTFPFASFSVRIADNTPVGDYSGFVWIDTNDPALPDDPTIPGVDHFFKLPVKAKVISKTGVSLGLIGANPVSNDGAMTADRGSDYNGRYIRFPGAEVLGFQVAAPLNAVTLKFTGGPVVASGTIVSPGVSYRIYGDDGNLSVSPAERAAGGPFGTFARDQVQHTANMNLKAGKYLVEMLPPTNPDSTETTPYNLTLSATSIPSGKAMIRGNGALISDGSNSTSATNNTDFGSANTGASGPVRTFVLKNEGSAALTINSIGVQGSDFIALTAKPSSPVAVGGTLDIQVQMLTASAGSKSSQLVVSTSDPLTADYDFKLVGSVVTPPNPAPLVNSFLCDPSPFSAGQIVTLRATASDSNGSVTGIEFFIDKNNNGSPDAGESLGVDGPGKGFKMPCNTTGYGPGVAFLAQAIDNAGARSAFSKIVATVINKKPVITSFTASPSPVIRGNPLTLFASASDPDESVKSVSFFWDQNKNGIAEASELLGSDGPAKGFKFTLNTANLPRGNNTFLAKASDNLTAPSLLASLVVKVNKA